MPIKPLIISKTFSIQASQPSVRQVLHDIEVNLLTACGPHIDLFPVRTTLAEVLNNIVEHAGSGQNTVSASISLALTFPDLKIAICDTGCPYPTGGLPTGELPTITGPIETLPEGGFGWHLIYALTQDVTYSRIQNKNWLELDFTLATNQF